MNLDNECLQELEFNMCRNCRFYDPETGECKASEKKIKKLNKSLKKSNLNRFLPGLNEPRLSLRFFKPKPHQPFMYKKNVEVYLDGQYNIYEILNPDHKFDETCGFCGKNITKAKMTYQGFHGDPTCSLKCDNALNDWIYNNIINRNGEIDKIFEEYISMK